MVSIVIPIYNEEEILTKNISKLQTLASKAEVIFVDGGSCDTSTQIAKQAGKVFHSRKGRSFQMNQGAHVAGGDIFLFLHADTIISPQTLDSIERKIVQEGFMGGCLTQRIDNDIFLYRLIETEGNLRAKITRVFYGDQGIFVKKDAFLRINGFPEVQIMEDVLFSMKLRKVGKTTVLPQRINVSARRWEKKGIIRTILLYSFINILFWLGFPLGRIKALYDDLR